jgi:hypothetical protein
MGTRRRQIELPPPAALVSPLRVGWFIGCNDAIGVVQGWTVAEANALIRECRGFAS